MQTSRLIQYNKRESASFPPPPLKKKSGNILLFHCTNTVAIGKEMMSSIPSASAVVTYYDLEENGKMEIMYYFPTIKV